jgi:hypothetical protein
MSAPRAVLTDLRREALRQLAEYHYLTTPQFYDVLGAETDAERRGIRRMLFLLDRSGLVRRSRYTIDKASDPFLRYQFCYRLSQRGLAALGRGGERIEKAPASIAHEVAITEFHLALARRTAAGATHRLYWEQTNLRRTVNPDALFALTDITRPAARSTFYSFLEIERQRQGHYRNGVSALMAKLQRYAAYRRTPLCERDWRYFSDYRVVVVVATDERRRNLLETLGRVLAKRFIWITTAADVASRIGGAIFRAPPNPNVELSLFTSNDKGENDE